MYADEPPAAMIRAIGRSRGFLGLAVYSLLLGIALAAAPFLWGPGGNDLLAVFFLGLLTMAFTGVLSILSLTALRGSRLWSRAGVGVAVYLLLIALALAGYIVSLTYVEGATYSSGEVLAINVVTVALAFVAFIGGSIGPVVLVLAAAVIARDPVLRPVAGHGALLGLLGSVVMVGLVVARGPAVWQHAPLHVDLPTVLGALVMAAAVYITGFRIGRR